jgi:hypothetical protein
MDADPCSFGSIGVIGIPGFARFYRYVMLSGRFPHHAAVGFSHSACVLFDALQLLGIEEVGYPRPVGDLYPGENPFPVSVQVRR